ncbi:max dimerization protein 4 [Protobothrops mucrosquamatus]|uniref:max dimerization protein 4 n=1 Tax=Protobothrops mucrosquamatus TaxID=103944 RepID=UPI0007759924|nr:max dimerization protein 4 [Protobothrops mucrosquamatus]
MEWNSLLMLLEAAEYLERREREAEHGYASALPFERACARGRTAARKAPSSRSSHNELEKHSCGTAEPKLSKDQILTGDGGKQKLEEQDRKALNIKEQLQREHRYLKRRLEQLSVQGLERVRTDSLGSTISTDSEQEVDIEGLGFTPAEMDSSGSGSDAEDSLQGSSSDSGYARPHRRHARLL